MYVNRASNRVSKLQLQESVPKTTAKNLMQEKLEDVRKLKFLMDSWVRQKSKDSAIRLLLLQIYHVIENHVEFSADLLSMT